MKDEHTERLPDFDFDDPKACDKLIQDRKDNPLNYVFPKNVVESFEQVKGEIEIADKKGFPSFSAGGRWGEDVEPYRFFKNVFEGTKECVANGGVEEVSTLQ